MGELALKRDDRFIQGFFKPRNPKKYVGRGDIIYRSGLELKFMKFCDDNPNVLSWASEPMAIPYFDTVSAKWRKYYVDNFVEIREGTQTKKYLIEIKDKKETQKPVQKKGKRKTTVLYENATYQTNRCKWSFADKFCKEHGMEFLLLAYSKKNGFEQIPLNSLNAG